MSPLGLQQKLIYNKYVIRKPQNFDKLAREKKELEMITQNNKFKEKET